MQLVACLFLNLIESYATLHAGKWFGEFQGVLNDEIKLSS